MEIGLLIGQDCPEALCPLEVVREPSVRNAPWATRTALGWTMNDPADTAGCKKVISNFLRVNSSSDVTLERQLEQSWNIKKH
jgi:hypothetical protein